MERQIAFNTGVYLRSSGLIRFFRIDDCRKRVIVHLDQIQSVGRLIRIQESELERIIAAGIRRAKAPRQ